MEKVALKGEKRDKIGTRWSERARKEGKMPAVIYGHKKDPVAISLNHHDFVEILHHGHRLFEVEVDGKSENLMIKDLQYDSLGKDVIHADLVRVDITERVQVEVPIELKGTAKGTNEGGMIEEHTDRLEVECVVTNIPETLVVSIKELELDGSIHASDVELPEGVQLISSPELLIATCKLPKIKEVDEEEEGELSEEPQMPEVIGEKKEEEETQEES